MDLSCVDDLAQLLLFVRLRRRAVLERGADAELRFRSSGGGR